MRIAVYSLAAVFCLSSLAGAANAQTNSFATNLSLGSSGAQITALQKILNRDPDTRVASFGPGSPGNESDYFGPLTKAAVVRFQEKYAGEVLAPLGLDRGTGLVGSYTRAKLNALSASAEVSANTPPPSQTPPSDYLVKESEKIDLYAGDKMLAVVQQRILAAVNSGIINQSEAMVTLPTILSTDVPGVAVETLTPRAGTPGTRVSVTGSGISSESAVYFGSSYIVRTVSRDSLGNFSFITPSIPAGRYDVAIRTGDAVSNTATFVVTDAKNPAVRLKNVSPSVIAYEGTLTVSGSGFSPKHNVVVTPYQKFTDVPSLDGKTLTVRLAPESLKESVRVGTGKNAIPMSLYVVNEYGFSDTELSFTMTI